MSCRISIVPGIVAFVLLACGKSTSNSDSTLGSGGTSSSVDGAGGGWGGSRSVDANTTETVTSGGRGGGTGGGATTTSSGSGTGGRATTALDPTSSTTGNEGGAFASGGAIGMTAEEAGCIVTGAPIAGECADASGFAFACPLELPTPDTCSECYEPTIDQQGHPINQCTTMLPSGGSCKGCCCKPTRSGCEERPENTRSCASLPEMPRYFACVSPFEEPTGCTLLHYSDSFDEYCCP